MKIRPNPFLRSIAALSVAIITTGSVCAANRYWDTTTTANLQSGSGAWDEASTALWSSVTGGSNPLVVFNSGDDAFFQTAGVNTVTLDGTVNAKSVTQGTNNTATTISGAGTLTISSGNISSSGNQAFNLNQSGLVLGATGTISASNAINIGAAISGASGIGFNKTGNATLTLSGDNSFTGPMTVNAGQVATTRAAASGTPFGTGSINLNGAGGALNFGSGAVGLSIVPNATGTTALTGGTQSGSQLSFARTAYINLVRFDSTSPLTYTYGSGSGAVLNRVDKGVLVFMDNGTTPPANMGVLGGNNFIVNGTAPTVTNGMVAPYYIGARNGGTGESTFLTYDATYGFKSIAYDVTNSLSEWDNTKKVTIGGTGSTNITADSAAYALRTTAAITIDPGVTVSIGDGGSDPAGLLAYNSISGGTLAFGASEALIFTVGTTGNPIVISSSITGSGGLTKSQYGGTNGQLTLTGTNSYSGTTTVNTGVLNIGNGGTTGDLGNSSQVVLGAGGTLNLNRSDALNYSGITGSGNVTTNGSGTFTLGANITGSVTTNGSCSLTLSGNTGSVTTNSSGTHIVSANITGSATTNSTGTLTLSGTNSLTSLGQNAAGGTIIINGGKTSINNGVQTGWGGGQVASLIKITGGELYANEATELRSKLEIDGGTLTIGSAATESRLTFGNHSSMTGEVLTIKSGTLDVATSKNGGYTRGFQLSTTLSNSTISGKQTGGNFLVNGRHSAGLVFTLGNSTATGTSTSYSISGGLLDIKGLSGTQGFLQINADAGGTSTTTFSLSGTGKLISRFDPGATSGGIVGGVVGGVQVLSLEGGTLVAGRIDAANLRGSAGGTNGTIVNNGSTIAPGDSGKSGKTTVNGNLTITSGSLAFDIGGTLESTAWQDVAGPGKHDKLDVVGDVVLGGALNVSLIDSYVPTDGDFFYIIDGGNVSGTFTNLTGGRINLSNGYSFAVTIDATYVSLSDYRQVESGGDNYASWATANGVTGGANGDSDNDGVKNLVEYALIDGGEHGTLTGNTITFTKRGGVYGSDISYDIESSTTLSDWATLAKPPVVENASEIKYTFSPGTPAKDFFRLKVVQTAP